MKTTKVYSGRPGYPLDPKKEERRRLENQRQFVNNFFFSTRAFDPGQWRDIVTPAGEYSCVMIPREEIEGGEYIDGYVSAGLADEDKRGDRKRRQYANGKAWVKKGIQNTNL